MVERREYRGRLFIYGYDAGEAECQDAEFVLMLGRLRNEGFRTPRIGAVSNTPKGVLTIFNYLVFLLLLRTTTPPRVEESTRMIRSVFQVVVVVMLRLRIEFGVRGFDG